MGLSWTDLLGGTDCLQSTLIGIKSYPALALLNHVSGDALNLYLIFNGAANTNVTVFAIR